MRTTASDDEPENVFYPKLEDQYKAVLDAKETRSTAAKTEQNHYTIAADSDLKIEIPVLEDTYAQPEH